MTSFYDSYDHYKKMVELQEKLRKSEEDRIRLEERFKILAQESRNRHDACINRLRLRYIEFLEEQRIKDDKNHKLFEALDRVDNGLALMTAKTDRLNVLRKQYEAYLHRIHKTPNRSRNIIDDSNIPKQHEDTYFRRDAIVEQIPLSTETKSSVTQEMFRLSGQLNRSNSPSASKFTKPSRNSYFEHCEPAIAQSNIFNQQLNNSQNSFTIYPIIPETANPEILNPSSSLQIFQQKQPYVSDVSPGRLRSLSRQTLTHSKKPLLEQMDTTQTASQIVMPERTNDSISQYRFLDVSPNRFTPMALQHYVQLSPVMQPSQQENYKASLDGTEKHIRITDEMSSVNATVSATPERNICGTSFSSKSLNLARRVIPSYWTCSARKPDYVRKSISQSPVRLSTTSDADNTMKMHTRFSPKCLDSPRLSMYTRQCAVERGERIPAITVENELDRYMDKIRKLHRDLDAQSLEEINEEEKKASDICKHSLSDDNSEFLIGSQTKRMLPKKVEKVLALADDLASRTADLIVANDSGKVRIDENRNLGVVLTTQSDNPISEGNNVAFSNMHEGRKTSVPLAKDKISNDIQLHEPKLDSRQNIEQPWKENLSGRGNLLEPRKKQLYKTQTDENADFIASSNDRIAEGNISATITPKNLQPENVSVYIAQESSLDKNVFDTAEELQPWNLDILQRRIKEIDLTIDTTRKDDGDEIIMDVSELNQDNIEETEFLNERNDLSNQQVEQDSMAEANIKETKSKSAKCNSKHESISYLEQEQIPADKNEEEITEAPTLQRQTVECIDNNEDIIQNAESEGNQVDEHNEFDNEQSEECNERNVIPDTNQSNESQIPAECKEYSNQNYYEDTNQAQNYETEYTGLNEEYNYEQNVSYEGNQTQNYHLGLPYEGNQDQNYDQDVAYGANQDQNYDENAAYETMQNQNYSQNMAYENNPDQGYDEYINQEYVQGSNEQYGEYVGEQYDSENQYENDPNMQYQEDSNQQYAYTYDEQYDLNQVSNTSANQPIECTVYEPNKTELSHDEQKTSDECTKLQEESEHPAAEGAKITTIQDKNETVPSENEPKKKKDVIKSLLDSDTDSTIERNVSNTESDFDFN